MTERFQLSGGRSIDLQLTGPEGGPALVFHHGTPGSAAQPRALRRAAERHGLRLVTTSRPGYGDSTRNPGRRVIDVAADTAEILDHLCIDRCLVGGWSGGGPHALACGARLGARVDGMLVICGVAPHEADGLDFLDGMGAQNIEEFGLSVEGEAKLRPYLERERQALRHATPAVVIESLATLLPEVDRATLTDEFGEDLAANFREAVRVGVDGWLDDDLAFVQPWGFDVEEVRCPVLLCQGGADLMVPYAHGEWLSAHLPNVRSRLEPGEGHLSWRTKLGSLLDELVAMPTRT